MNNVLSFKESGSEFLTKNGDLLYFTGIHDSHSINELTELVLIATAARYTSEIGKQFITVKVYYIFSR